LTPAIANASTAVTPGTAGTPGTAATGATTAAAQGATTAGAALDPQLTPEEPPRKNPRPGVGHLVGSNKYMYKLYINYQPIAAKLYGHGDTGESVLFKQILFLIPGGYGVTMQTFFEHESLALGITVGAIKQLLDLGFENPGVSLIRVVNGLYGDSPQEYDLRILLALAQEAGLDDDAELYIAGPEADIMLRAVDGEGNVTFTKL